MTREQGSAAGGGPRALYPTALGVPAPFWILALSALVSGLGVQRLARPDAGQDQARWHASLRTPERTALRFVQALGNVDGEVLGRLWEGPGAPPEAPDFLRATPGVDLEWLEAHRLEPDGLQLVGSVRAAESDHRVQLELRERHGRGFVVTALTWLPE